MKNKLLLTTLIGSLSATGLTGCEQPNRPEVREPAQAEATGLANASNQDSINLSSNDMDPQNVPSYSVRQGVTAESAQPDTTAPDRVEQQGGDYPKEQKTVYFGIDGAELDDRSKSELDELAGRLTEAEAVSNKISVTAMAPTEVSDSSDMAVDHKSEEEKGAAQLARQRAEVVKEYLQERGVESEDWEVTTIDSFVSSTGQQLEQRVAVVIHVQ